MCVCAAVYFRLQFYPFSLIHAAVMSGPFSVCGGGRLDIKFNWKVTYHSNNVIDWRCVFIFLFCIIEKKQQIWPSSFSVTSNMEIEFLLSDKNYWRFFSPSFVLYENGRHISCNLSLTRPATLWNISNFPPKKLRIWPPTATSHYTSDYAMSIILSLPTDRIQIGAIWP